MKLVLSIGFFIMMQEISFKEKQKQFNRVKDAYAEKEGIVKSYFETARIPYSNFQVFLRAIKDEEVIEVWIKPPGQTAFQRLTQYNFCASSGVLGPKRKEGDLQIPEGVYYINHFNPQSNFHLSLGISYPNSSDKILGDPKRPGSAIYIHGNCVTVGCIPITDERIKELYVLCVEARNNGQDKIPVHIFPSRLSSEGLNKLRSASADDLTNRFWKNLQPIYLDFEEKKILNQVAVNSKGEYYLNK